MLRWGQGRDSVHRLGLCVPMRVRPGLWILQMRDEKSKQLPTCKETVGAEDASDVGFFFVR